MKSARSQKPPGKSRKNLSGNTPEHKACSRCGKGSHSRDKCPAKDATCFKCQKRGNFGSQCFSKDKASQHSVDVDTFTSADSTHSTYDLTTFLDVIHTGNKAVWTATLKVNQQEVVFKLDTGAEVTAISETVYKSLDNISLQKPTRSLVGPAQHKLQVLGEFTATLTYNQRCSQQSVYIVRNLNHNLLGLPAILALKMIVRVAEVSDNYSSHLQQTYRKVFAGLGTMQGEYTIKLRPDATPVLYMLHAMSPYL